MGQVRRATDTSYRAGLGSYPYAAIMMWKRRVLGKKPRTCSAPGPFAATTTSSPVWPPSFRMDGLGASGWTDRAAMVVRHEFDPNRFVVALDCLDVDYLVNPITEDASWLPTVALGAEGGAFVTWSEDLGLLGSDAVTVTEGKTATAS